MKDLGTVVFWLVYPRVSIACWHRRLICRGTQASARCAELASECREDAPYLCLEVAVCDHDALGVGRAARRVLQEGQVIRLAVGLLQQGRVRVGSSHLFIHASVHESVARLCNVHIVAGAD